MMFKPRSCYDAYCAGLMDGEGHITVSKRPNGRGAAIEVGVTNTNLELLNKFLVYGGRISKPRLRGLGTKLQYTWKAHSVDAKFTLEKLLPYLIRLSHKAQVALKIISYTPTKGKHLTEDQVKEITKLKLEFYAT